jgi:hypothetical protein
LEIRFELLKYSFVDIYKLNLTIDCKYDIMMALGTDILDKGKVFAIETLYKAWETYDENELGTNSKL